MKYLMAGKLAEWLVNWFIAHCEKLIGRFDGWLIYGLFTGCFVDSWIG